LRDEDGETERDNTGGQARSLVHSCIVA
jgi:hypothetical protein